MNVTLPALLPMDTTGKKSLEVQKPFVILNPSNTGDSLGCGRPNHRIKTTCETNKQKIHYNKFITSLNFFSNCKTPWEFQAMTAC